MCHHNDQYIDDFFFPFQSISYNDDKFEIGVIVDDRVSCVFMNIIEIFGYSKANRTAVIKHKLLTTSICHIHEFLCN